jgi:hypothetical protein
MKASQFSDEQIVQILQQAELHPALVNADARELIALATAFRRD